MNIDDPKWRSPLTHSTLAEIKHQRKLFRKRIAHVNAALLIIYADRKAALLAAEAAIEGESDD